ncbi:MAG: FkbM family methyltransferase [Bacteroidetes bacterium]|nr:FkbM family methyltransferase [Bacteroidota bacterium]
MISAFYRKLLPLTLRQRIYNAFLGKIVFFFRHFGVIVKSKTTYLFSFLLPKTESNKAFAFMGKHGLTSYPNEYALEYKGKEIDVLVDGEQQLPYVIHRGKKLYFPHFYDEQKVKKDYRALLIEQDERAAHRYVRSYQELTNRTLLDVGAAEGVFSLDAIELTKQVILFECEEHWQKPLQATFEPWRDKVTVVKKYIGDKTSGVFITIDDYLMDKTAENLFIKMDIEGAERMALQGAHATLSKSKNVQVAICTYHRPGDPEYMNELLNSYGYTTEFTQGLMYWNKRLSKGIIRGRN